MGVARRRRVRFGALFAVAVAVLCFSDGQASASAWRVETGAGFANAIAPSNNGAATATFECTVGGVSSMRFAGIATDKTTSALGDQSDRIFLIFGRDGTLKAFAVGLHYNDLDDDFATVAQTDPLLLATWASHDAVMLVHGNGAFLGSWALEGTGEALRAMGSACGAVLSAGLPMGVPLDTVPLGEAAAAPAPSAEAPRFDVAAAAAGAVRAEAAEFCDGPVAFNAEGLTVRDINADGHADAVVDWGFVECDGMRPYCGIRACTITILASDGARLTKAHEMLSMGVTVGEGSPPLIEGTGHHMQGFSLRWNGVAFEPLQ